MKKLTIGKLASECDVNIDTIRYYERKNILTPIGRTETGYRLYSSDSVTRLQFIRTAQTLGFTLKDILELIDLQSNTDKDCGDVLKKTQQQIQQIDDKIAHLLDIKETLNALATSCPGEGSPTSECTILNSLIPKSE